jgi:hypothetical protein
MLFSLRFIPFNVIAMPYINAYHDFQLLAFLICPVHQRLNFRFTQFDSLLPKIKESFPVLYVVYCLGFFTTLFYAGSSAAHQIPMLSPNF